MANLEVNQRSELYTFCLPVDSGKICCFSWTGEFSSIKKNGWSDALWRISERMIQRVRNTRRETLPDVVGMMVCKSLLRWLLCYWGGIIYIRRAGGHSSSKDSGSPSKFSFLWHALFLMRTHINKAKSAGTESADCVTVWPLGQASFLVPPVLTLACERLKLFQIFPLNIYPAWTPYGKIPGTRMDPGFQFGKEKKLFLVSKQPNKWRTNEQERQFSKLSQTLRRIINL